MRLKEFNPVVLQEYQITMPKIRFSGNNNIYISAAACDLLNLVKGNSILFYQDQDNTSQWYICKDEKGFIVKNYNGNKTLYFISKKLRINVSESINNKEKSFAFRIMPKQVLDGRTMCKLIAL